MTYLRLNILSEMGGCEWINNAPITPNSSHRYYRSLSDRTDFKRTPILSQSSSIHRVTNCMYINSAVTQQMCRGGQIHSTRICYWKTDVCLLLGTLRPNTLFFPYVWSYIWQHSVISSKCPQVVASFGKYTFNSIPRLYGCDDFITDEQGEETACLKRGRHKICGIRK